MNYWLIKSEPEEFSFQDLANDHTTQWTGVRNYAARNNLKGMKVGDPCLFYHSVSEKAIVGLCTITREHYPDPTFEGDRWVAVDVSYLKPLNKKVLFDELKTMEIMKSFDLVRISRLSCMPVSQHHWDIILKMAETTL